MRDDDSLSRRLMRHQGLSGPRPSGAQHGRILDDHARARLLDASLGVLTAVRALAKAAEDVLRDRRAQLASQEVDWPDDAWRRDDWSEDTPSAERASGDAAEPPGSSAGQRRRGPARERIPLTY